MWAEAGTWLDKFPDAVLTMTDRNGYPASVRVPTGAYDTTSGELSVALPDSIDGVAGPANLLCHSHDEKLWKLQMITVKGTIEERETGWVFRSTDFNPPSKLAILQAVGNLRRSAQKYLDKRGLPRPEVNWAAVKEIQRRAKG